MTATLSRSTLTNAVDPGTTPHNTISTITLNAHQLRHQLQSRLAALHTDRAARQQWHAEYTQMVNETSRHDGRHSDMVLKQEKYKFMQQYKSILPVYHAHIHHRKHQHLADLHHAVQQFESLDVSVNQMGGGGEGDGEDVDRQIYEYEEKLHQYTAKMQQRHSLTHALSQSTRPHTTTHAGMDGRSGGMRTTELSKPAERPRTADAAVRGSTTSFIPPMDMSDTFASRAHLHHTDNDTDTDTQHAHQQNDELSVWMQRREEREKAEAEHLNAELAKQRTALLHDVDFGSLRFVTVSADETTDAPNIGSQPAVQEDVSVQAVRAEVPLQTQAEVIQTHAEPVQVVAVAQQPITSPAISSTVQQSPVSAITAPAAQPAQVKPVQLHSVLTNKATTPVVSTLSQQHESVDETQYNTNDLSLDDNTAFSLASADTSLHQPKRQSLSQPTTVPVDSKQAAADAYSSPVRAPDHHQQSPRNPMQTPSSMALQFSTNPLASPDSKLDTANDEFDVSLPELIQPTERLNSQVAAPPRLSLMQPSQPPLQAAVASSSPARSAHRHSESSLLSSTTRALPLIPSTTPTPTSRQGNSVISQQHQPVSPVSTTRAPTASSPSTRKPLPALPPTAIVPPPAASPVVQQPMQASQPVVSMQTTDSDDELSASLDAPALFSQMNTGFILGQQKSRTQSAAPTRTQSSDNLAVQPARQAPPPVVQRTQSVKTVQSTQQQQQHTTSNLYAASTAGSAKSSPHKMSAKPRRTLSGRLLDIFGSKNKENVATHQMSTDSSYEDESMIKSARTIGASDKTVTTKAPHYKPDTASILGLASSAPRMDVTRANSSPAKLPEDDCEFDF